MSEPRLLDRWNPYQRFTVRGNELHEWLQLNGPRASYDGKLWQPRHRAVFGGRDPIVEVWFEEAEQRRDQQPSGQEEGK